MHRARCRTIAALLLLFGALVACDTTPTPVQPPPPQTKPIIRMGAVPAAYYLPVFVVQEKGLLKKRGYESTVAVSNSNTTMLDDFYVGDLDVTAQSSATMFPREANIPGRYKFIYGQNSRSYAFLVLKASPIKSMSDLKGKRIATWRSPTARLAVELCVQAFFDPNDMIVEPMDFGNLNDALYEKRVDAVFSTDVFIAKAIRDGRAQYLEQFPLSKYVMDPFFNGGGFIQASIARDNPAQAKAIQEAFEEAIQFIHDNEREARLLMAKYVPAEEADLLNAPIDEYIPNAKIDLGKAQELADILFARGQMEKRLDVRSLFFGR